MGILDAFLGGVTAASGAAADIYADQIKSEAQMRMEEQRNRWQADRDNRLHKMQTEASERAATTQFGRSKELAADQHGYISQREADSQVNSIIQSGLQRDEQRRQADQTHGLGRDQLRETTRYHDKYIDALTDKNENKLPKEIEMKYSFINDRTKTLDKQIQDVEQALSTKPEYQIDPKTIKKGEWNPRAPLEENLASLKVKQAQLGVERTKVDIEHRGRPALASYLANAVDAEKFQSMDEWEKWIGDAQKSLGPTNAKKIREIANDLGILQDLKALPRDSSTNSTGTPMRVMEGQQGILDGATPRGPLGQVTSPSYKSGITETSLSQMDLPNIRGLMANRHLLTENEQRLVRRRLEELRGR